MGKDWYRLGGHGGVNGKVDGGGGTPVSSSTSKRKTYATNGCMAALHHLFDFQHFYFNSHHRHHLTIDSPARSKGLKLVEDSTYKNKQSLNNPASIRVRTEITRSKLRVHATDTSSSSSEICNSPGTKTPSLVARLMGLDLLPHNIDFNHPHIVTHHGSGRLTGHRFSKKSTRLGTKSLPESPRISSARKSDFDIHRLSLQLNKENKHEGFRCSRLKEMKQEEEESLSPREYARQIVKQIKERVVTRRVGMDITNSVMNREAKTSQNHNELRRDSTVSCSARTRFSDKENTPSISHKTNFKPEQITQKPKPLTQKPAILVSVSQTSGDKQKLNRIKKRQLRPINICKKVESEPRFSPRPIKPSPTPDIRSKQREAFVSASTNAKVNPVHKKKCKKIPISDDLDNISVASSQKQKNETTAGLKWSEDALIRPGLIYKIIEENAPQEAWNHKLDKAATVSITTGIDSEHDYITRIMNLRGINTDSPVSSATQLSASIFFKLEESQENRSGSLSLRCNRKLLFDLVNEILIDIAELHTKQRRSDHGSDLISQLSSAVASYSHESGTASEEKGCTDVEHVKKLKQEEYGEEEGIIAEIERDIIDQLVRETTSALVV